ncbi:MAG: (2Fe-2S)-binding protein [Burkholderiales bacterium]|nr:(2Fe-2S)-binding protein [Burkholderiales bacterium]
MIVCLCHRVSDRDIQREVGSGTRCFEQLQGDTRVASSCGKCLDCALEVFDAALKARADRQPAGAQARRGARA